MSREFVLAGNTYTAPDHIGAGVLARIQANAHRAYAKQFPKKAFDADHYSEWLASPSSNYAYTAVVLNALLTRPKPTTPPVIEAFDSATDAEVAEIMGFFGESMTARQAAQSESQETSTTGSATSRTIAPTKKKRTTKNSTA